MSKQTAVEWLLEELNDNGFSYLDLATDIIEQAKEMEKEQQEMAFNEAIDEYSHRSFEEYYNETFKGHTRMTKQTTVEHLVKFPEISGEANTTSSQDTIAINPTNQGIIMTPKQKADDLVDRFYQTTPNETWITEPSGEFIKTYTAWGHAKQCALIAVDEMLNVLFDDDSNELFHHGTYKLYDYYLEVEKELEKL